MSIARYLDETNFKESKSKHFFNQTISYKLLFSLNYLLINANKRLFVITYHLKYILKLSYKNKYINNLCWDQLSVDKWEKTKSFNGLVFSDLFTENWCHRRFLMKFYWFWDAF